jgi:hypothetical protein
MPLTSGALQRCVRQTGNHGREMQRRARLCAITFPSRAADKSDGMTIRLADGAAQERNANMLLNRMYSRRGYGNDHQLPTAASCTTFAATSGEDVVGTLTLIVDSEAGLAAERTFRNEIEPFRNAPGAKVCESPDSPSTRQVRPGRVLRLTST